MGHFFSKTRAAGILITVSDHFRDPWRPVFSRLDQEIGDGPRAPYFQFILCTFVDNSARIPGGASFIFARIGRKVRNLHNTLKTTVHHGERKRRGQPF